MNDIRLITTIESDMLHLPELKSFIGKKVEIVVRSAEAPNIDPGNGDWPGALDAVEGLEDYDLEAYLELREYDKKHMDKTCR